MHFKKENFPCKLIPIFRVDSNSVIDILSVRMVGWEGLSAFIFICMRIISLGL